MCEHEEMVVDSAEPGCWAYCSEGWGWSYGIDNDTGMDDSPDPGRDMIAGVGAGVAGCGYGGSASAAGARQGQCR